MAYVWYLFFCKQSFKSNFHKILQDMSVYKSVCGIHSVDHVNDFINYADTYSEDHTGKD